MSGSITSKLMNDWKQWTNFRTLASRRRFQKISYILDNGEPEAVLHWLCAVNDTKDDVEVGSNSVSSTTPTTALHILLPFQPPLELVENIIVGLGTHVVPEDSVDGNGQTPLHVAVTHACHPDVIARLTQCYHSSCISAYQTLDQTNRTPLHCLCDCLPPHVPQVKMNRLKHRQYHDAVENVAILMRAYPKAASLKDVNGKTPIDLAESRGVSASILSMLKATESPSRKSHAPSVMMASEATEVTSIAPDSGSEELSSLGDESLVVIPTKSCHGMIEVEPSTTGPKQMIKRKASKFERLVYEI